jgi:hypothetical protein
MSRTAVFAVFGLLLASAARGAEFSSPRGYSLKHPDTWKVLTAAQRQAVNQETQRLLNKMGNLDLDKIDAMVVNPIDDGFFENVNVVVVPGVPRPGVGGEDDLAREVSSGCSAAGIELVSCKVEHARLAGREVLTAHCDLRVPKVAGVVRQWQAIFPHIRRSYIVTCSAQASSFERYEPIFADVLNSMQYGGGLGDWWDRLPAPMRWGALGGVIGGLVGPWLMSRRRRRPPAAGNEPPAI